MGKLFGFLPGIMKRTNIELGDTGTLTVTKVRGKNGIPGVFFEIGENSAGQPIPRASVLLSSAQTRFIIKALCTIEGIPVTEHGIAKLLK